MADLRHIDSWLFDLDNTLYPRECGYMAVLEARMTGVVARLTGLSEPEAAALRMKYLAEHGTTLAGLMLHHDVAPEKFLEEAHDAPVDCILPDPALAAALEALPGRRLIFTNGDEAHARRVLDRMEITHLFDDIFHIAMADYVPKPSPATFARMISHHVLSCETTCFFEDRADNLATGAQLGMTTVLVGQAALENRDAFVHHRTPDVATFLAAAKTSAS